MATRCAVSCWQLDTPVAHIKREARGPYRHLNGERKKGEEANERCEHDSPTIDGSRSRLKVDLG